VLPPDPAGAPDRGRAAGALQRSVGVLSTAASAQMESDVAWFRELEAQERSWVGQILQAGIRGFVQWYATQDSRSADEAIAATVFGAAPRALTGVITLQQTVDLVRLSIAVVERNIDEHVDPRDADDVRDSVLRYGREVAFATAEVYARAAEARGAWDARLEALVVDAVLRAEADETIASRASALGWHDRGDVVVVLGDLPRGPTGTDLFDRVRRAARTGGMDALCGGHGDRLVVLLGGAQDPVTAASAVAPLFGPGPVVAGPVVPDLGDANLSARSAAAAHRAAAGWPEAPRPVASGELLPERALAGDGHARRHLVEEVYTPLRAARGDLLTTLTTYLEHGGAVEATARELIVHPNTVRYRLRQVADVTGFTPSDPRHAFALRVALVLGRQRDL
jgi:hypothetical protein